MARDTQIRSIIVGVQCHLKVKLTHYYFFVLLFLLVDSSLFSSAFRFAPVLASFPFASFPLVPFPCPFNTFPLGSLGWTVKKPSRRPCCFALRNFWSFSAPFRMRSSLHQKIYHRVNDTVQNDHELESFFYYQKLHQAVYIRVLPFELSGCLVSVWHTTGESGELPRFPKLVTRLVFRITSWLPAKAIPRELVCPLSSSCRPPLHQRPCPLSQLVWRDEKGQMSVKEDNANNLLFS